jgi:hypothetical protein
VKDYVEAPADGRGYEAQASRSPRQGPGDHVNYGSAGFSNSGLNDILSGGGSVGDGGATNSANPAPGGHNNFRGSNMDGNHNGSGSNVADGNAPAFFSAESFSNLLSQGKSLLGFGSPDQKEFNWPRSGH